MNSNNFVEYVAVNKTQLDDMVSELDSLKNREVPTPQKVIIPDQSEIESEFMDVINSLPLKCQEQAKQIITHLLKGRFFGYNAITGEILRSIPEKCIRYKIKCSNLRDILSSLTRLIGPNQQPQKEESMVEGMRDFLQMLAATPLGSTQINDPMLRKLFQQYRKELT